MKAVPMSGSLVCRSRLIPSAVLDLSGQQAGFGAPSRNAFLASKGAILANAFSACSAAGSVALGEICDDSLRLAVSFLVRNLTLFEI